MRRKQTYSLLLGALFMMLFSCADIVQENNIVDENVTLVAPANNALMANTGVVFSWENLQNASKYRLQIARPDFNNPIQIVLDTLVSTNSFSQQLNIGNYQWRVKAVNSAYETPYQTRNLTVVSNADFQSNTVVLFTPNNSLITNIATQNLSWQSIIGATGYQVQVTNVSNTIVLDQTVTNPNLSYTFPEGALQWKVRATNGTQQTMYTSRNILVDITNPNTPVLTTPANSSTVSGTAISFQWTRTPIVGSTEKDSIYIFKDNALTNLQLKNQASTPFSTTLVPGIYFWYIKAFDQAGNMSNRSSVFTFTAN